MAIVPFGEYLPDQPAFGSPGTVTALNVVPRTQNAYGPMPSPVPNSAPLPARVCGSYAYRDAAGHVYNFAATQQHLYLQMTGQSAYGDVSGLGSTGSTVESPGSGATETPGGDAIAGLSGGVSGGAYNTDAPPDGYWQMTSFGNRIIATNYNDPVQTYLAGVDTHFSNLSATAPRAKFCCVIRDFLMLGNTYDSIDGAVPYRLAWSAIGDPTNWPAWGSNTAIELQSDYQDLVQTDMGAINQVVGGHLSAADGAALCERGIYRIQYAGSPAIFDFAVAQGAQGTDAPGSVVMQSLTNSSGIVNAVIYYLGNEGFYAFDGTSSTAIGAQKIDRTFLADLDVNYLRNVQGTWAPTRKLILWFYHGAGNNGLCNRCIIYNWELSRWSLVDLTPSPVEWVEANSYTVGGYTLDELDVFGNLEQLQFSFDSLAWTSGNEVLGWFDGNHIQNYMTGPSMAVTITTPEAQLFPDRRARIIGARPLHDAVVPASVAVGTREMQRQGVVYQGAIPENILGDCPQRCTGRYVRFRMTLPAGANFNSLQGVDVVARPEGVR